MNKMELDHHHIDYYIEYRLKEWASWHLHHQMPDIGFSRRSIIGRLMDEGGCLPRCVGPKFEGQNLSAEEIEELILEMFYYHKLIAEAIRVQYTYRGSQQTKATKIGISVAQYKVYLNMARAFSK